MRYFRYLPLFLLALWIVPVISAQDCPIIVRTAVETTDAACQTIGRNQLCYGNARIEVTPQETVRSLVFSQTGDIANITDIQSLHLLPLDRTAGTWGVALMRIQANLADTLPGQNVTFVLFGDVEIENASQQDAAPVTMTVTSKGSVNLRVGPSRNHAIYGALDGTAEVNGKTADGAWLRLRAPNSSQYVWVAASVVTPTGDLSTLPVVDAESAAAAYEPMQAFYFKSGVGDAPCAEAPDSGILIQTPRGAGQVTLSVNGIDFSLGSTALLYNLEAPAAGSSSFAVSLLDGKASYPGGSIYAGQTQAFVTQNSHYAPQGSPQDFNPAAFDYVPLSLLPDRIDIPQRGTFNSAAWSDVVFNYYPPSMGVTPNGCVALLLHNAGADNTSWSGWMIPGLRDSGWGVFAPDMPAHGQTPGNRNDSRSWNAWVPVALDAAAFLQSQYGYSCGVFAGSSIGANASAYACAQLPGWCIGAALLSPGNDYLGSNYPTMDRVLPALGSTPIYIMTGERDKAGASGSVARKLAGTGQNVTTQIYDTDLHGSYMSENFPLWEDMRAWWDALPAPGKEQENAK